MAITLALKLNNNVVVSGQRARLTGTITNTGLTAVTVSHIDTRVGSATMSPGYYCETPEIGGTVDASGTLDVHWNIVVYTNKFPSDPDDKMPVSITATIKVSDGTAASAGNTVVLFVAPQAEWGDMPKNAQLDFTSNVRTYMHAVV